MNKTEKEQYWLKTAEKDWEVANHLFQKRDYSYALFFGHLTIEKIIKAVFVNRKDGTPPFSHNLVYLAEKASIDISDEKIDLLEEISDYNLEARYPDAKMATSANPTTIELVKKYLSKLREENIPVQKALLFGSYVKGNYKEDSDIDIAIVSSVFQGDRFLDRKMIVPLRRKIDTRIEPIPFTPDDFSRGGILIDEIKKTGQVIQL